MEKKKIGTQVDERFLSYLKDYCAEYDLSMSKLIHKALTYYIRFIKKDDTTLNPLITIAKNEFVLVIDNLNEEKLKELAELAFLNAMKERKEYINKYLTEKERKEFQVKPRIFLKILMLHVFGYEGQNWFKEFRSSFHDNRFTIAGIHNFNLKFSIFFKYFMKKHMLVYGYSLVNEKLSKEKIFLDFNKD